MILISFCSKNQRTSVALAAIWTVVLVTSEARASCGDYLMTSHRGLAARHAPRIADADSTHDPVSHEPACRGGDCGHKFPVPTPPRVRRSVNDSIGLPPTFLHGISSRIATELQMSEACERDYGHLEAVFHPPRQAA
jgi:hypothetical protein